MTTNNFLGNDRPKSHSGFTLLELMIVVVLISILATMAVPTFTRTMPRLKARAEARNMLNFIRTARSRAISENSQYGVYFDTRARQYVIFKDTVNPSTATYSSGDSLIGNPTRVDPSVVYSTCTFANSCVVFLASGAASQSGAVTLNTCDGSRSYSVSVLAATGKSKIQ